MTAEQWEAIEALLSAPLPLFMIGLAIAACIAIAYYRR